MIGIVKPFLGVELDRSHPLSNGLVCSLPMLEQGSSTTKDYSGSEYNGVITAANPPTSTSGWGGSDDGGGIIFDLTDDQIALGELSVTSGVPFTMFAKVYLPDMSRVTVPLYVVACIKGSGSPPLTVSVSNYTNYEGISLTMHNLAVTLKTFEAANTYLRVPLSLCVSYNGGTFSSAASWMVVTNGVSKSLVAGGPTGNLTNTSQLGTDGRSITKFAGTMSCFHWWNRALSLPEAQQLCSDPYAMYAMPDTLAWLQTASPAVRAAYYQALLRRHVA